MVQKAPAKKTIAPKEEAPASTSASPVVTAKPIPQISREVKHELHLDPTDWFWAMWRDPEPLKRPEPPQFDQDDRVARIQKHRSGYPFPAESFIRASSLTPEEGRFWLAAMSTTTAKYGNEHFKELAKTLERSIVSLATNRGLMLIGEPGTAKSYLRELLAAAISGDSTLVVQGSAGTTEDNIKYSWNYALLLAEGPSEAALVPAPLYRGLKQGKIVRFEEITRCPVEIQDTLLSILSERVMAVPELPDDRRTLFARAGFNVIATANTRDQGVNEMSAALKRRQLRNGAAGR
jgi:hypothetical protein